MLHLMLKLMLLMFLLIGCGSERKTTTTTVPPAGGGVSMSGVNQNDCSDKDGCDPIYTKTVVAVPTLGAAVPSFSHYTMLDTPNANLCADAFIRSGIDVPADIIARTLSVRTGGGSNSLVTDSNVTTYPVMTIIDASQCNSSVMLQLLNPNGYYCFAGMNSCRSSVTIQRSCASKQASIEPMEINNQAARGFNLFWWWHKQPAPPPTPSDGAWFGSYNQAGSTIKEVPCIP